MQRLHAGLNRLLGKKRRAIAAAFNKSHARHHRVARQRIEREDQRLLHQAVDDQAMLVRVDVRRAAVNDREMQAIGRERAVEQMVRRARMLGARLAVGIAERAHDLFLVARAFFIGRADGAGHLAPRIVAERLGGRGFRHRITCDSGGERGAAGQKSAAIEQPVARGRLHILPLSFRAIFHRLLLASL